MGSYAWVVSGDKTASGNPIVYSGPQMGFETPSIVTEGSIRGGGSRSRA
jgi:penicillin G amidase